MERRVLISPDGLGRLAIALRSDGFYSLYEHWLWSSEQQKFWNVEPVDPRGWIERNVDPALLYDDRVQPLPGIFQTIEQAEVEARSIPGFKDASVWSRP